MDIKHNFKIIVQIKPPIFTIITIKQESHKFTNIHANMPMFYLNYLMRQGSVIHSCSKDNE